VYPALSILQALQASKDSGQASRSGEPATPVTANAVKQSPPASPQPPAPPLGQTCVSAPLEVLWVGAAGGMEADLVKREGLRFEAIRAGQVHGVSLSTLPRNLWQLARGFLRSLSILRKFRPDVLLFTGGYLAVPMAFAARLMRQGKSLLFVPDIEPGWALKTLARFADQIALTVEASRPFFSAHPNVIVTGYPLRPGLQELNRSQARTLFALRDDLPVLLVMGGSKGSHSINQALQVVLPELLKQVQVIHLSGNLEWALVERSRKSLPVELQARYRPYPYLHNEMGAALQAADLVVSRAGASTLGEYPLFGLPAILVPYPYAWRYQRVNAQYLQKHGAAILVDDQDLAGQLMPAVLDLLFDREKREAMRAASRVLAQPQAAVEIAGLIQNLAPAAKLQRSQQPVANKARR